MGIKEIEEKLLEEAQAKAGEIESRAQTELEKLKTIHEEQKQNTKDKILNAARLQAESIQRGILAPARIEAKKALLEAKQRIIGGIYEEIRKEKKLSPAELGNLRERTEIKAAQILFES